MYTSKPIAQCHKFLVVTSTGVSSFSVVSSAQILASILSVQLCGWAAVH